MLERNALEGNVLGAINKALGGQWWDNLSELAVENIRDELFGVWEKFFPETSPSSEQVEPETQPTTDDKTAEASTQICPFFEDGEECFSEMTTLKCCREPCVNQRGD